MAWFFPALNGFYFFIGNLLKWCYTIYMRLHRLEAWPLANCRLRLVGLGHLLLRQEIAGSNPAGGTIIKSKIKNKISTTAPPNRPRSRKRFYLAKIKCSFLGQSIFGLFFS